jgi:hypothetical protein
MPDMQKKFPQDPKRLLQTAIEELSLFTQSDASRLEVGEDGRLVAAKESRLERVVGLARCYIGPLFSDQMRKEQEKRLLELKEAILRNRDIIQSHSALIAKLQEGDDAQRELAKSALSAIQRYNDIVAQSEIAQPDYDYARQRLLLDQEIKGQQIELPHVVSVKYASHPDAAHPAHKMLKELSQTLRDGAKNQPTISPKHKESRQFLIDTFQMKAIRLIQTHLQKPVAEIVPLVKQTTPEIDEESHADLITMQQFIEVDAGSVILVTGCFSRQTAHSKFMTMPIPDSFRLSSQLTHTGFPYPSQHTGWALADKWVNAFPLRADQTPTFQQVHQRRKLLAHRLLFDQEFIQQVRSHFKIKREIFDQNREIFLSLHRQLQQALKQGNADEELDPLVENFYQEMASTSSAFDLLTQTQQQVLNLFVKQPIQMIEEEWLGAAVTPLRTGLPQEKYQAACLRFEEHNQQVRKQLDLTQPRHAYIWQRGLLLGGAFRSIALQYQSEKMGFSPPLLNDFERKLQICAFQQLIAFLDECEHRIEVLDPAQMKGDLLIAWSKDLQVLETSHEVEYAMPLTIVNELERYFTARFYSQGIK